MSKIHPVSVDRHGKKCWHKSSTYKFAEGENMVVLSAQELVKVALHAPTAFVPSEHGYVPVGIQGLQEGQNMFVAPDGKWLGRYIPIQYQAFPFRLARRSEDKEYILCVDEELASISEARDGIPFFDAEGKPSPEVVEIFSKLLQVERDRAASKRIHEQLKHWSLVEPWPITVQKEDRSKTTIEGLYRVAEARLRDLAPEALAELRDSGAMLVIYCQLISMQNLPVLGALATERNKLTATFNAEEQKQNMLGDSGVISFENLR